MSAAASLRTPGRRAAALGLACALVAALASRAAADTASDLAGAKARLASLTKRIASEEQAAARLQDQLAGTDAEVTTAERKADDIAARLATTERELAAARARYEALRGQLNALARNAYIQGPLSGLELILDATSLADLTTRLQYVDRVSDQDAALANRVANLEAALALKRGDLRRLRAEQAALLARLARQEREQAAAVAEQARVVTSLQETRRDIVALVSQLGKQLRAEELSAIGDVFQGGGHITYGAW